MTTVHNLERELPPELWAMVVRHLPCESQRSLLFVSRFFHDLALPVLFNHVVIHFGFWRYNWTDNNILRGDWEMTPPPMTEEEEAEMTRRDVQACEILHHIARTSAFARVVKKMSIRAHFLDDREGIFELFALKEALLAMTNITSFQWEGRYPFPSAAVLDALVQSSGDVMREISLPWFVHSETCLEKFRKLQSLVLYNPYNIGYAYTLPESSKRLISDGIDANRNTLARLTLYGDVIWSCPIRSVLDLYELEIMLPESLSGFELILRHCTSLHSLTLDLTLCENEQFMGLLQAHPDAITDLANFLKEKKKLRMLDLADDDVDMEEGSELPLSEMLRDLPALEVLGYNAQRYDFLTEDIAYLGTLFPPNLSALLLNLTVDGDMSPLGWVNMFSNLTSLQYLHIIDMLDTVDLRQQLLENHPQNLELVGYNMSMRWIEHDTEQNLPKYSLPWPASKVRFSTAEDFGCKDWEWLFRYHSHRGNRDNSIT